ncbi:hypothetical protein LTR17_016948 [Elasticomyces elasticus]|nr:hypothetical protein LTR17_016948 [Elasticomyces elasticus]
MECGVSPLYTKVDASRKEIRLLILRKAKGRSDDIHCDLRRTTLSKTPKALYQTVSYVWGDVTAKSSIYVNDQQIEIGRSAEQVLRRFRSKDRDVILWIDAVCVDQSNDAERSEQVAIMDEIYSKATHNIVWLGEDEGGLVAKAIIPLTAVVHHAQQATNNNLSQLRSVLFDHNGIRRYSNDPAYEATNVFSKVQRIEDVLSIFNKPWFERLWVVQEAVLPKSSTVYCGDQQISLRNLLLAAAWLTHNIHGLPSSFAGHRGLVLAAYTWHFVDMKHSTASTEHARRISLFNLLDHLQERLAHDPKDYVYGLLGLYKSFAGGKDLPKELYPAYTKTVAEVYQEATRIAMIEHTATAQEGEFFAGLYHRPREFELAAWPSWVPRWNRPFDRRHDAVSLQGDYTASRDTTFDILQSPESDSSILALRGLIVGRVHSTEPVWTMAKLRSPSAMLRRFKAFVSLEQLETSVFALTLIAGTDYFRRPIHPAVAQEQFQALLYTISQHGRPPATTRSELLQKLEDLRPGGRIWMSEMYQQSMEVHCRNRRLFKTLDGKLGLGLQVTKPDDYIVVLYGFRAPVILRPIAMTGHYRVCGKAYVHDVMNGRWLVDALSQGRKDEVLYLH